MTFAPSTTLTQDAVGWRMVLLANHKGIADNALERLNKGDEEPIAIAQSLTDGVTTVDVFGDDKGVFVEKLEKLLGKGMPEAYESADELLDANKRDTAANRAHILEYWKAKQAAKPGLTKQIRDAFILALKAPEPVRIRWGDPKATGASGTGVVYTPVGGVPAVVLTVEEGT